MFCSVKSKSVRITPELELKLVEMQELSGISQSEIIRLALSGIKVLREKPSKELMNSLLKVNNVGTILSQIRDQTKDSGELDYDSVRYCITQLNSLANEIRRKFL